MACPLANDSETLTADGLRQNNPRHHSEQSPIERIVVRMEISDTGTGIDPTDMVKLFCMRC